MRWLPTAALVLATLTIPNPQTSAAPEPPPEPPEVDTDSLQTSIQLREGLRILERYETFRLFTDYRGIVVETEPEPADSIRLDALGWESGPGMQEWILRISTQPDENTDL